MSTIAQILTQILAHERQGNRFLILGNVLSANAQALIAHLDAYDIGHQVALEIMQKTQGQGKAVDLYHILKSGDIQTALDEIAQCPTRLPVALFGFGRIGRYLARLLTQNAPSDVGLALSAIVLRPPKDIACDLAKRASLLERDSVHGRFLPPIKVDADTPALIIGEHKVKVIYANAPDEVDYVAHGLEGVLVIDNTGKYKDAQGLGLHLKAPGAKKVLLTAPASGDIKNIVFGVNEADANAPIVSAASCTTNAITPTLQVMDEAFGIKFGHVETIHSYTNDQNLIDNQHKADRRGRAAAVNMVITATGAAKAVAKALPNLAGKLTGNAIRVPTPNVSLAILNLELDKPATLDEVHKTLKDAAHSLRYQAQIGYSDSPEAVSTDFIGALKVGILDAKATLVMGNKAVLYLWYDNEAGYSTQVLRVAQYMMTH